MNSIIGLVIRNVYERETGKRWSEIEEHMAEICSFYEYQFSWNENGNIVIDNKDNQYEYESAEAMVNDWLSICKESNEDYVKNGLEKPFGWC